MARPLRLIDFDLLQCVLTLEAPAEPDADAATEGEAVDPSPEVQPNPEDEPSPDDLQEGELELEGVTLRYSARAFPDRERFELVLQTTITDPLVPYSLEIVTGSRFETPDPPATLIAAVQTLIFVSYPYVRETVAAITGRTPYPAFRMPPLIRLPHPRVVEADAADARDSDEPSEEEPPADAE